MRDDNHIFGICYGLMLGAGLALFVGSLSSRRPETATQLDEVWLTSVRESGW